MITLMIADDSDMVRDVLGRILGTTDGLRLVGCATSADEAVKLAAETRPDVAIVDVSMPGGGVLATIEIGKRSPATKVIALSGQDDHQQVMKMLEAGATGYLVKSDPIEKLIVSIREAVEGRTVLSSGVAGGVIGELLGQRRDARQVRDRDQDKREKIEKILANPGTLEVVGQPIFDLVRNVPVGQEALSRFHVKPRRPTYRWFALAREVGLGLELELAAATQAVSLLKNLPDDQFIAINLSPSVVSSKRFRRLLDTTEPERIVVELTEHLAVSNYDLLSRSLKEIRDFGVRIAVDDAGAGYSSLRHLLKLRPDIIKLDISLVKSIEAGQSQHRLVRGIVEYATGIDAWVIAEGIETEAERTSLLNLGISFGQGYLLARPRRATGQL